MKFGRHDFCFFSPSKDGTKPTPESRRWNVSIVSRSSGALRLAHVVADQLAEARFSTLISQQPAAMGHSWWRPISYPMATAESTRGGCFLSCVSELGRGSSNTITSCVAYSSARDPIIQMHSMGSQHTMELIVHTPQHSRHSALDTGLPQTVVRLLPRVVLHACRPWYYLHPHLQMLAG